MSDWSCVRPPGLVIPGLVQSFVLNLFPFHSIDASSVRELDSYEDRNYYFRGSVVGGEAETADYVLKILNCRDSKEEAVVDGLSRMVLHLKSKGFNCPYPVKPLHGAGKLHVVQTESKLRQYCEPCTVQPFDKTQEVVKGSERIYIARVLVFVPGQTLGKLQVPHTWKMRYQVGQFVGSINKELQDFENMALQGRRFEWDLKHLLIHRKFLSEVQDLDKLKIATQVFTNFEDFVVPKISLYKHGFIHNDPNDLNIIVSDSLHVVGLVDFSDCVHSCYIFELGMMLTYAMIDKEDPLAYALPVLSGYLESFPLPREELDLLYYIICGRLIQSVLNGESNFLREPDNKYLLTTVAGGWKLIRFLFRIGKEGLDQAWSIEHI